MEETINKKLIKNLVGFWKSLNKPAKTEFIRSFESYFNVSYETLKRRMRAGKLSLAEQEFISNYFAGEEYEELLNEVVKFENAD